MGTFFTCQYELYIPVHRRHKLKTYLSTFILVLSLLLPVGGSSLPVALASRSSTSISAPSVETSDTVERPTGVPDDWFTTVQQDIRRSEYHIIRQNQSGLIGIPASYQAPNRSQNLRTYFTATGIRIIPRVFDGKTPPWAWGIRLSGYGFDGNVQPIGAPTQTTVNQNRFEYQYTTNTQSPITEWYINDERGIEQGFTLNAPPPGNGSQIVLDLTINSSLIPCMSADGEAIEFATAGGVTVLRYSDLSAVDAAGRTLPAYLSVSSGKKYPDESSIILTIDATNARYPVSVDPLTTTPDWTAEGNQANATFGWSVDTAGDVNGDGYSDVIISASSYDHGQANEGMVFIYHGSANGLSTTPDWTDEGNQVNAGFGYSVSTAGDVNGDGYADIIIGAPFYEHGQNDEGKVWIYYGSANGLSSSPDWTAESNQEMAFFGRSVSTAGDVNGDGYTDIIIGANRYDHGQMDEGMVFVYYGSANGLSSTPDWTAESDQANAWLGSSVSTAGDVNGDGYADIIVSATAFDHGQTNEGQVYLYFGSASGLSSTPAWTAEGNQENAFFGHSVSTAGDVNGDGFADIVISAHQYDHGQTNEGMVFVYYGSSAGLSSSPDWTAEGDQANANFGVSVSTASDVNGDGYADIIIGAFYYDHGQTDEGMAFVYYGSSAGLSSSPDWTAEGNQTNAELGHSVGTAGDVNGDGYADVIVGAPNYEHGQTREGTSWVYYGSSGGLSSTPCWTAEGNQANAYFGWSVGTAGDVNGDGYADVIIGAPFYDHGQLDEGRVFVYYGSSGGLSTTPAWTAEGNQVGALFGWSVGTAGDVNGDGYPDVIIGAPAYTHEQTSEGQVFVYYGSAGGLSTTPAWTAEGNQISADFGYSVSTAEDTNGDGYADVIIGAPYYNHGETKEGRVFVYNGSAGGLSTTPAWTAESNQASAQFGRSVSTAGDVNGDGYAEVIIGAPYYNSPNPNTGQASVYYGSSGGLSTTPDWTAESNQAYARFGSSVGTAGDVNGDGYADIIIGEPDYDHEQTSEGRVVVYYGDSSGLSTTPNWTAESNQTSSNFGNAVNTAGDVNGDGYSDIIIGAMHYNHGETYEGMTFVYHGSASGLSSSPDWTAESNQTKANLGYSVGTAGDINGDGYADIITSAHFYDNDQTNEGGVFVYYGNSGDGLHMLPQQHLDDGSTPIAHLGSSNVRGFQISLIGRMPLGRQKVRLQWQAAPLGTPITATNVISGVSSWTDALTTGVEITQTVAGLIPSTHYHWRARLLYWPGNALGMAASRWLSPYGNSWNEADLRTVANTPPVSSAGDDQTAGAASLVTLNGSASSDPDGDLPLTYLWSQTGGITVTLSDATSVSPTFTAPSSTGVLTFTLTVSDSLGLPDSTPDEVVITIKNYRIYLPMAIRKFP